MTASALLLLALGLTAQNRAPLDTAVPAELVQDFAEAAEVERDPKRGPDTAMRRLEAAREGYKADTPLHTSIRLREAGIFLRKHFGSQSKFTPEQKAAQKLSTYTRLDLREPGLEAWLQDGLHYAPKADRTIKVALLMRGVPVDKKAVQNVFKAPFKSLGFKLDFVPAKKAHIIMKLSAKDSKATNPKLRAVRLRLDFEGLEAGEVHWKHGLFRTAQATTTEGAVGEGLNWLAGIGGRDLFFHHLGEQWPELGKLAAPTSHEHPGDNKPPKARLGPGKPPKRR